ncbi:MAG: hypothetical protein ABH872_04795 [Candidatus Omnitrophota bacterium]
MDRITMEFSPEQYRTLVEIVYLGEWMINSIRTEPIAKYEKIESYIYSFCRKANAEDYIEYDNEMEKFFPTRKLEEDSDAEAYRENYDDDNFWDELIHRLARRDLVDKYGEKELRKMNFEEIIKKEQAFIDRYSNEFEKDGIENVRLSSQEPLTHPFE